MEAKSAREILLKHQEDKEVKDKTVRHTKRVVALCGELADRFESEGIKVNWKLLEAAAWLHDVAKKTDDEDHQRPSVVKEVLEDDILDVSKGDVTQIIKYHKRKRYKKFNPDSYKIECAILCICDKIDKLNKTWEKKEKKKWNIFETQDELLENVEVCLKYLEKIYFGEVLRPKEFDILFAFCMEKMSEFFHASM